jgi:hypothetical protein
MIAQWRKWLNVLAVAAMGAFATPACAQTAEQFDRLNTLTHYGMVMAWCEKLGMKLAPNWDGQLERGISAEVKTWNLAPDAAKQLIGEAVTRQSRLNKIDLDVMAQQKTKTDAGLGSVRSVFLKYGSECLEAARDRLFSGVINVPTDFELNAAATAAADSLLADGGLASWQTPAIQARGDLMMAAGTCRSHIGAARSDTIFREYSHATAARERAYYVRSFDEGLSDTSFNFDRAQCERLIKRLTAKADASK